MSDTTEHAGTTSKSGLPNGRYIVQLKRTLQQQSTKRWTRFVVSVYTVVAVAVGLQFSGLLLLANSQTPIGGTAIATLYVLLPLFASGILAVGLGLYVGGQTDGELAAVVVSGIGSYLGYGAIALGTVVATRVVGSDFVSSALGMTPEGLLAELLLSGVGVGLAGMGAGYLGHRLVATGTDSHQDPSSKGSGNDIGFALKSNRIPGSLTEAATVRATWTTVYTFALVGGGFGVSIVLLNLLSNAVIPLLFTLVASYAVVFSAPLLAAYLGLRVGRTHPREEAVTVGFVGGGVGFVAMVLVMVVFGAFGPDATVLNNLTGSLDVLQGNIGAATNLITDGVGTVLGTIPRGYELSRILFIGGLGSAVSGAVAASAACGHGGGSE